MKYSIGDIEKYVQTFSCNPVPENIKSELAILGSNVFETLQKSKYQSGQWAICGGAALTYLLLSLGLGPTYTYTQDLDIYLDRASPAYEEFRKEHSVVNNPFPSYTKVPVIDFNFQPTLPNIYINGIQIVNCNPAAVILSNLLRSYTRFTKHRGYVIERLATYSLSKVVNQIPLSAQYVLDLDAECFYKDVIRYLASFDITHAQVAIVFNDSILKTVIVSDATILDIIDSKLSLTQEQLDMFSLPRHKIISRHLDIVSQRILKYANRYSLEVPNHVRALLTTESSNPN
jgi:hypothetical protein